MTTIIYIPERGGLGDSTIGCMNAFILSKVLNATFKIVNGPINFYNYFDIPDKYKLNNIPKYDNFINYDPFTKYNDYFLYDNLNALKNKITFHVSKIEMHRVTLRNTKDTLRVFERNLFHIQHF